MLSTNTNLSSLIAQSSLKNSTNILNQAIERMSTGHKINHASDNAANYSIATNMTTKIGAYQVAEDNVLQGLDMVNTASENLSLIEDKLQRLRALATQASNGTYGDKSFSAINAEATALVKEVKRLYNNTEYNNLNLFKSEFKKEEPINRPVAGEDGFIVPVIRRDTSTMTRLISVDENATLTNGTYSISSVEELQKLSKMVNNGYVDTGDEFVLSCDINLAEIENWSQIGSGGYDKNGSWFGSSFRGKFDGNGFSILNMSLISNDDNNQGLFGYISSTAEIKNLAVVNAYIDADSEAIGIIAGQAGGSSKIYNCYTSGTVVTSNYAAGGILGSGVATSSIDSCYSTASVYAGDCAGGLVGTINEKVSNSYFDGEVYALATYCSGGITGRTEMSNLIIDNCYVNVKNAFTGGVFVGYVNSTTQSITIKNSAYNTSYNNELVGRNTGNVSVNLNNIQEYKSDAVKVNLQVGISSNEFSQILAELSLDLNGVDLLERPNSRFLGKYFFTTIDDLISRCSAKQTEYGAVQNRLESALEEISVQYENLVSSRSTLRDADIAEVSSEYIRQQILQQASATLMSAANQSPSIALQLI